MANDNEMKGNGGTAVEGNNRKQKTAIIVLSILLAISLVALGGTMLYKHFKTPDPTKAVVTDNLIDPQPESTTPIVSDTSATVATAASQAPAQSGVSGSAGVTGSQTSVTTGTSSTAVNADNAASVSLYSGKAEDNTPFNVTNFFPGDSETKYYRVKVSHKGTVTLRFHADIRPGGEKLAEVLMCRVKLLTTNEVLYEGLMRDMPAAITHKITATEKTESERYYEITAWLDTSVGNEYQDKPLTADFKWWVEETEALIPPQTGFDSHMMLWVCLAAGSLILLILIFAKRKKEEGGGEA